MRKDNCRVWHRFTKGLGHVIGLKMQLLAFQYSSYDFLSYSSMCDVSMSSIYFTRSLGFVPAYQAEFGILPRGCGRVWDSLRYIENVRLCNAPVKSVIYYTIGKFNSPRL